MTIPTDIIDVPALHTRGPAPGLSERYRFISTYDLISPLVEQGWEMTQAFQVRSKKFNPYAKHLVRLTHAELKLGSDRLEAVIRNSHDGNSKLEFMLGAWRCVCSNGLILGTSFSSATIAHTKTFDYVQERAQALIDQTPEVAAVFDAWKAKDLSSDESHALAAAAAVIRWGNQPAPVSLETLLEARREEDRANNLWVTYNRLQEALVNGDVPRLNDHRRTRRVSSIDQTVRINKALWQAASSLYQGVNPVALPA